MTDRDEIRRWADENDRIPVRRRAEGGSDDEGDRRSELVRRDEMADHHEEHEWDSFLDEFERNDRALIHDEEGEARIVDRDDLGRTDEGRTTGDGRTTDDEVAEELAEGETVETQVTEREVVETEVVEEATIESEVVGSEVVHREVVDTEIVDEEIVDVSVTDESVAEVVDEDGVRSGDGTNRRSLHDDTGGERIAIADRGAVVLEIDEERTETVEEIEEKIVESRVVDTNVEETTREGDESIDVDIGVAGIHEHIEAAGVIDTDSDGVVDERHIETEFDENDVATSTITEERTVENVIEERKTVLAEIDDVDVDDRRVVSETVVDSEFVEPGTADARTDVDDGVHDDDRSVGDDGVHEDTRAVDDGTTNQGMREEGADTTAAERTAADDRDPGWSDDDVSERLIGTDVETPDGESLGIVSDVDEESRTIYVDEDPGMTDKLKASLHWGDDDDKAALTSDQIRELDSGKIVVDESELRK